MWADNYEGQAYKYDVRSKYPSIMRRATMLFPVKRGTFHILDESDFNNQFHSTKTANGLKYGIYRCQINRSNTKKDRLFRFNVHNYYTHFDLWNANKLGLEVEIIQDGQPNALIYTRDKLLTGSQLFGLFIDLVYPLKEAGVAAVKPFLKTLWGALCQRNLIKITKCVNDEPYEIQNTESLKTASPLGDGKYRIIFANKSKAFETPFARIGAFLTSKCREEMANLCLPFIDHITMMQTDGFVATKQLDIQTGPALGGLKFEGFGLVKIERANQRVVFQK
jgi:hypothetical protein